MKKIMIAIMFLNGFVYGQNQSTNTIGSEVPVYEYVPKVIIEGKWGKGEGEFGRVASGYLGTGHPWHTPNSLAVNSKGEIYILDPGNNRIQKFNKDGKYLKSILIESLSGKLIGYCIDGKKDVDGYCTDLEVPKEGMKYDWPIYDYNLTVEGINIVIDNKDRMYYYLKRSSYSAEGVKLTESGEVWEFVDDKLRKKWEVPGNINGGLSFYNDSIWITEAPFEYIISDIGEVYNVIEKKKYIRKQLNVNQNKKSDEFKVVEKSERLRVISNNKRKININSLQGEKFISEGHVSENEIRIISSNGKLNIRNYFNKEGMLYKRINVDSEPRNGFKDLKSNIYRISEDVGIKIIKYELLEMR